MSKKKKSIIIAIDNHYSLLNNFFNHLLFKVNIQNCEIILIVDGCRNIDVLNYINELDSKNPQIKTIILEQKVGYSVANNLAVKAAIGDYLLFINTDVFPEYESIQNLVEYLIENNSVGIAQGILLYPQTNLIQSTGHIFGEYFNRHALANSKIDVIKDNKVIKRQALTSAFYAISKSLFTSLGGFDEFYFNCWDGMELSLKATYSNMSCVCLTDCVAYHATGGARNYLDNEMSQQSAYFWSKWGSLIKNDLVDCLKEQLNHPLDKHFICINCSSVRNHILYLNELNVKIDHNIEIDSRFGGSINLYFELPFKFLTIPDSLIFMTNKYTDIASNKNWLNIRNNPNDLVIDTHGNLKRLVDLL